MNPEPITFPSLQRTSRSMLSRLYQTYIEPKTIDEDVRRREYLLNIILLISIGLLCSLALLVVYSMIIQGENYDGMPAVAIVIPLIFFILLLVYSRRYDPRISSYILISILYGYEIWVSYTWGVDLPSALLGHAMIITMAGVLIGVRASFVIAVCSMITIIGLGYGQIHEVVSSKTLWRIFPFTIDDGVEYSIIILIISLLSWLSNGQIERSLVRARNSEEKLKVQNENLEKIVEDRTKEVTLLQAEKLTDLYRFVEFGKLSSGLFHDLASPLTALHLQMERLGQNNPANREIGSVQTYIHQALELSRRIHGFIKSAKKSMRRSVDTETFRVRDEIIQSCSLLETKIRLTDIDLSIEIDSSLEFSGSTVAFHHIIINLVSNAVDACSLSNSKKYIFISALTNENDLVIKIKDTGVGIEGHILPHIFDAFFTTKKDSGCGIGLSATKFTLEKYFGGTISVESKINEGTSFTLVFPKQNTLHNNEHPEKKYLGEDHH